MQGHYVDYKSTSAIVRIANPHGLIIKLHSFGIIENGELKTENYDYI